MTDNQTKTEQAREKAKAEHARETLAQAQGFSGAHNTADDPENAKTYVNHPDNGRVIRNNRGGRAGPGEAIELTDVEAKGLRKAGYTLDDPTSEQRKATAQHGGRPRVDRAGQEPIEYGTAKQDTPRRDPRDPTRTPPLDDPDFDVGAEEDEEDDPENPGKKRKRAAAKKK